MDLFFGLGIRYPCFFEVPDQHEIIYILHLMLPFRRSFPGCHLRLERSGRERNLRRFQQLDGQRRANGYYPQSNSDTAIIGENAGTITWSTGQSYFGATNTVQIDSGSTLLCTTEIGDLNVNSFTLKGNSQLIFESSNALGLGRDFTLNFGTFTAEEHGSWVATNLPSFWTNGKTVTFVGTLDMNNLSGSGTIELASIKSSQLGGNLNLDLSGLDITGNNQIQADVTQVTENDIIKVLINYETVPEPATATLSLLGLGGLLLRRKRQ